MRSGIISVLKETMKRIFTYAAFAAGSVLAQAQSTTIADIQQDFSLMRREVGQLRLEVEQLRLENKRLAESVKNLKAAAANNDGLSSLANSLRTEMTSKDEASKREILAQIKSEMESLAAQTNASLKKLADAIGARPQGGIAASFSESYPKSGTTHTVVSGDTISGIARKYNSRTKWIQDANRIADPSRDLTVGRQIFVPQE